MELWLFKGNSPARRSTRTSSDWRRSLKQRTHAKRPFSLRPNCLPGANRPASGFAGLTNAQAAQQILQRGAHGPFAISQLTEDISARLLVQGISPGGFTRSVLWRDPRRREGAWQRLYDWHSGDQPLAACEPSTRTRGSGPSATHPRDCLSRSDRCHLCLRPTQPRGTWHRPCHNRPVTLSSDASTRAGSSGWRDPTPRLAPLPSLDSRSDTRRRTSPHLLRNTSCASRSTTANRRRLLSEKFMTCCIAHRFAIQPKSACSLPSICA